MTHPIDTLVIGAGAAGLAAARHLHDAGVSAVVVEARDRIGGRAHTSYDFASHPVELGAEFIHGENVCTWALMERFGMHALDQVPLLNVRGYVDGKLYGHDEFLRSPMIRAAFSMKSVATDWLAAGRGDASLLEVARVTNSERGVSLTAGEWATWSHFFAQYHAADPDQLGAAGWLEPSFENDGVRLNFRITEGYSALLAAFADGLDVRLSTPVQRIEWDAAGVRIHAAGETLDAERVIVTLPLGVLQEGGIVFDPPLPDDKQHAIEGLGAGAIAKIILRFDEQLWPDDLTFLFTERESQVWWRPGRCRDDEAPVLMAFFGGSSVAHFRAFGEDAPLAALDDLETMLGRKLGSHLVSSRFVDWQADPYTRTGYSSVPPGGAGLRDALAAPIGSVLYFAGEATNRNRPATVHGALESGYRAAHEVMSLVR